ncbi:SOS response-associated peptidase family protein [Streptomyces tubercidicus]
MTAAGSTGLANVLRDRRGGAAAVLGLVLSSAKTPNVCAKMINARVESVAEKPAYRRAFAKRRRLLSAEQDCPEYVAGLGVAVTIWTVAQAATVMRRRRHRRTAAELPQIPEQGRE